MRQYIIASHAHFATGIKESVELLSGARDNVHDLSMFVDGRMDVFALAGEQPNALDDSRRKMGMGCNDKLPHSIPLSCEFRHKNARTHAPGQGAS